MRWLCFSTSSGVPAWSVVVTPHVAWLSPGSVRRLRLSAARRLLDVLVAGEGAPTSAGGIS